MVNYDSKEWLRFFINFPKADTVRKLLPFMMIMGIYSLGISYLILDVWELRDTSDLRNISLMHSLLGFVISLLLVFRTNTAYDRWWEGRRLWGSLVNNSRNLALKINTLIPEKHVNERNFYRFMIPNFAFALKNHLRGNFVAGEFTESESVKLYDLRQYDHVPNQIAGMIISQTADLQRQGILLPEHLLFLNPELQSLMDICGACERIHKTPIPYSYSAFLKKFIIFYCITLPLGYVFSLHYLVIPFVIFIFYVLASLEIIAEEIEDPFGNDSNDLPLDDISAGIRTTVGQAFSGSQS